MRIGDEVQGGTIKAFKIVGCDAAGKLDVMAFVSDGRYEAEIPVAELAAPGTPLAAEVIASAPDLATAPLAEEPTE